MTRLIIVMLLLAAMLIAAQVVLDFLRPRPAPSRLPASRSFEVDMPDAVQKIAYVLLIVLAFGVTSGWLGGLG